jgi:CelD/BcsL family acetyltransferase involved in cellulose biosynthesis
LPAADLIDFRKMPARIGQRHNPLALLPTRASAFNGNVVRTGDDYSAYMHKGLKRVVRKELERSWRVFVRHEAARFCVAREPLERASILTAVEDQQRRRMNYLGKSYELDRPEAADFYRRLVDADPHGKFVIITALMAGEEAVAALVGLRSGHAFIMIRISTSTDPAWTNCSPGRLVIERTMAHLHELGVREFDFSIGNYDYKRRFGVEPSALVDLVQPLTPLGFFSAAATHARSWLRQYPEFEGRLRRALGRSHAAEHMK